LKGGRLTGFKETRHGFAANLPSGEPIRHKTLKGLVEHYLKRTGELASRDRWKSEQLRQLGKGGYEAWNQWRRDEPHVQPMLAGIRSGIDFSKKRFDRYDFSYANFTSAELQEVYL